MRRCCEETLRVLREHKESLLTVVEVFIHDPLYRWAMTPAGAQQRQARFTMNSSTMPVGLEFEQDVSAPLLTGAHGGSVYCAIMFLHCTTPMLLKT